ncbi:MAG: hypothetical protein QOJ52_1969 [Acidimicrobiaceae bacterium]|jgi:hypothetical protein|nr:hypothetical protein [Acidimicrobiaceae bacterium]MDQ1376408.1 hypothetical protein [Acidimicrobiaceae bacterium]MDQ1400783.1 hypothetical protein [Acidimicrobiaceae bacterium]MDQ1420007.1 hypothetical protein [Acidimicrobiaceae bacterium]MDQ1442012.1 hypothetical protein [Acidimicrobiaceae bacterium]
MPAQVVVVVDLTGGVVRTVVVVRTVAGGA